MEMVFLGIHEQSPLQGLKVFVFVNSRGTFSGRFGVIETAYFDMQ